MAGAFGADVDQLRALAKKFTQSADQLEQSSSGLSKTIANAAFWRGNDANRFRTQWKTHSTPSITSTVNTLRIAADALARNADEQEKASAASGSINSATTGRSTQSKRELSPAQSTSKLWDEVWDAGSVPSGYRVQEIKCIDGKTRYIVYLGGTKLSLVGGQSMPDNIDGIMGQVDWKEVKKIQELVKGSEVMLVGYSQGGIDAQNIAAAEALNVKQIVTFGSPTRNDVNVSSVNLQAGGDLVPKAGIAGGLGNPLSPYSPANPRNWIPNPNKLDFHSSVDVDSRLNAIGHHTAYDQVADAYDKSIATSGPPQQGAHIQFFQGEVVKETDI